MDDRLLAATLLIGAPFIGSFLALLVTRLPDGRPVAIGRSRCDACGRVLGPLDLVPLLSFAALRGRCRQCGAPIERIHPFMEVGAFALALWAAFLTTGWTLVASCVLGWLLLSLAAIDWRTGLLPDALTLPLGAIGLGVAYVLDPSSLVDHVIGAAAGFVFFASISVLYRRLRGRDGLGLGDAKLLAAAGAWLGWIGLPTTLLFAACLGLAVPLLRAMRGAAIKATDRQAFGPALAAATWLVWLYGPLVPT